MTSRQRSRARHNLKRNYGLSLEQYEEMQRLCEFKCAICHQPETDFKRKLAVDHDHRSGNVRALLCVRCNNGIGYFKEKTMLLMRAIVYLNIFETANTLIKKRKKK